MRKVLVVDDDKDILEVVELLLTIHNYTVNTIFRAADIFNEIKKFEPDLILLDVNIAGQDGREICKLLRTIKETENIPVILFSAIPGLEQSHLTCGATDFLTKPFDVSELIKKIEKHLNAA
jgi:DNA-binding response OmpR family regulator